MLGEASSVIGDDLGLANCVEQRSLSVVDMTHDRHHRRALFEVLVGVLMGRVLDDFLSRVDDLDLAVKRLCKGLDRLLGQGLRQGCHLAQLHQLLDQLGTAQIEGLSDLLDGRARVDLCGLGLSLGLALDRLLE